MNLPQKNPPDKPRDKHGERDSRTKLLHSSVLRGVPQAGKIADAVILALHKKHPEAESYLRGVLSVSSTLERRKPLCVALRKVLRMKAVG